MPTSTELAILAVTILVALLIAAALKKDRGQAEDSAEDPPEPPPNVSDYGVGGRTYIREDQLPPAPYTGQPRDSGAEEGQVTT